MRRGPWNVCLAPAIAICLFVSGATCTDLLAADSEPVRFILDWAIQGQTSPWTLAEDRGWFLDGGARVSVHRGFGSADTIAKVAGGAYDVGYADIYALLRFRGEHPTQKLIAFFMVHDKSALSVATLADSTVRRPADLVRRTIAAPVGDASRDAFPLFAAKAGFDPAQVRWLTVSPELREAVLLRRQADAVSGHALTIMINLQSIGVDRGELRLFLYSDYGVPLYGHFLFTTHAYADAHPEALTAIIRGTVRGIRAMIRDPQAAVQSVRRRDPLLDPMVEQERIRVAVDTMFVTPRIKELGFGSVDLTRLASTLSDVSHAYRLPRRIAVQEIYTSQFLPATAELSFATPGKP